MNKKNYQLNLLENPEKLQQHISRTIFNNIACNHYFLSEKSSAPSAVLFLLGLYHCGNGGRPEPCLILNKRSQKVKQPGDLCCPGGGLSPVLDSFLAKFLTMPGFPMKHWLYWDKWHDKCPKNARNLLLFFANGLREGFEEMRLNPLGVKFLGPLPHQNLIMFRRVIYPLAGWVMNQKNFVLNWEVEKIVYIPLRDLLNPENYACYRLQFTSQMKQKFQRKTQDFPCFLYKNKNEQELLWGATFRITAVFMEMIFGFLPPETSSLPVIPGVIQNNYTTGATK